MARQVLAGAVVPTAPMLLEVVSAHQPEAVRDDVAQLRATVRARLAELPEADVTILVADGARAVHDRAIADLVPFGADVDPITLPVHRELATAVTRVSQYPLAPREPLGPAHTVLAALLHDASGGRPVLPVSVPATADGGVLVNLGAGLVEAVRATGLSATMVVAGDLSASLGARSPRYVVEGAVEWDEQAMAALTARDGAALAKLGPEAAARVHARAWAPLVVAAGAATTARLRPAQVAYRAPLGVGYVTAGLVPESGDAEIGARFRLPADPPA